MKEKILWLLKKDWLWAALAGSFSFMIYLFTLCPSVFVDDSGELIVAGSSWGIPHPSGYPLWVLLANVFSRLPGGAVAWKINLMSALFSSLTIVLLFLLVKKVLFLLANNKSQFKNLDFNFLSFISSLTLAFSTTFWSQSLDAEVYTLNAFFVALMFYLLVVWYESRQEKLLLWLALIAGLATTNHQMIGLMYPAMIIFVFLVDWRLIKNWYLLLRIFLLFLAGLLVYLYLPIASRANPPLDWSNPENWSNFWQHVSRKIYNDFKPLTFWGSKIKFLGAFFINFFKNFFIVGVSLIFVGLIGFLKKNYKIALLLIGGIIGNTIFIILLREISFGSMNDYFFSFYYLPTYVLMTVFLAYGIFMILNFIKKILEKVLQPKMLNFIWPIIIIFTICLPSYYCLANWNKNNLSDAWFVKDYFEAMLQPIEQGAIFWQAGEGTIADDTESFGLLYSAVTESLRPDIIFVNDTDIIKELPAGEIENFFAHDKVTQKKMYLDLIWQRAQRENRSLYTSFIVNKNYSLKNKLFSRSLGNVYKIFPSLEEAKKATITQMPLIPRNIDDMRYKNNFSVADLMARYYFRMATFYTENGFKKMAQREVLKGIELGAIQGSDYYNEYSQHRLDWLQEIK